MFWYFYDIGVKIQQEMALKTLVKVSEVNNLSDARYCAGMGVDLIGFTLDAEHPNLLSPENHKAITGWIEGINIVAEFDNADINYIKTALSTYKSDYIQISTPELITELKSNNISLPIILRINLKNDLSVYRDVFETYKDLVSHFLIESETEDVLSEKSFNELKHLTRSFPIIIGFGIKSNNLEQILSTIQPIGLALKGGEEIRPGYKDFDELADILEELELD